MIEFKTKLDENTVACLAKFQLKKLFLMLIGVSALFVLVGTLILVLADNFFDEYGWITGNALMGICFIVLGVLFTPVVIVIIKSSQKKLNKSMSVMSDETEVVYTFSEDEITVSQKKGDDFEGFTRAKYNYLFKVVETKTHYILYVSKVQCHVIDKATLTQGSLEELNAHLSNNLHQKFQPMKSK